MTDTFFTILRKTLVATIALMFAFVVIYIPQEYNSHHTVPEAQALFGVDIPNLIQNTISAVVAVALRIKELVLDGIAWGIAKAIISRMMSSLIDWINSGFKGKPSFVTDIKDYLYDAANLAKDEFLDELGADDSFLCEPFKLDIQVAIAEQYAIENPEPGVERPYEGCDIRDAIENVDDFLSGTFEEGGTGWKNWINITTQPEKYTELGQRFEAEKGLAKKLAKTDANEKQKLNIADGFKAVEKCEKIDTANGQKDKCAMVSPLKLISQSLEKRLGAGQDSLVAADEISEVIGALIGQLANKAITGAGGLLGLSQKDSSGNSYTASAASESVAGGTGASNGLSLMQDAVQVQTNYKALADSKIPTLQAYIASRFTPADKRVTAQNALADAQDVQLKAPPLATKIQTLVTSYQTLDTQIANTTDAATKEQLKQQQLDIISNFTSLNAYTQEQLDGSKRAWDPTYF